MNVRNLIGELETLDGDMEVRIAMQPQWPFEHSLEMVAAPDDDRYLVKDEDGWYVVQDSRERPEQIAGPMESDGEAEDWLAEHPVSEVVYLVEGDQIGYLPGHAKRAAGWA